eukprot:13268980-Ditylum_brightwellii.AAC.1
MAQHIQAAVDIFLWYARDIDLTTLPALNEIALQQAVPTETTICSTTSPLIQMQKSDSAPVI